MPIGDIKEEFYEGTTFTTLPLLEKRCETDEKQHTSKLTKLELAENENNKKGTLGTYERVRLSQFKKGLIFRDYKTEAEANLLESTVGLENPKMFRTTVQIGDKETKIIVFRKKQS